MKKILLIFLCLVISSMLLACFDLTDEASDQNEKPPILTFRSLQLQYKGAKYPCWAGNPILCELPYKADITSLPVYYTVDEGVFVYVNGAPLVSGESVFDFTNGVAYVMKDKFGNEETDVITVIYGPSPESQLYSMSVLVYNSSTSAYDLEYPCSVDETNKKVTVAISDKTKSQLNTVKFKFVISDNAIFSLGGIYKTSEESLVYLAEAGTNFTITILSERTYNPTYKPYMTETDYQFNYSCIDCRK